MFFFSETFSGVFFFRQQVFTDMKSVRAGSLEDEFDFLAPR